MNIAIVIYSDTGKTLKLAELAREKLSGDGHQVSLTRLQPQPPLDPKHPTPEKNIAFGNLPDVTSAELIIFGGPVWGFRPCPAIRKAVSDLGAQIKGKTVLCFVTHAFPFAWMTGTCSVNSLRKQAGSHGAKVLDGVVLSGSQKKGDGRYAVAAEKIRDILK